MAIHEHIPRRGILKGALAAPFAAALSRAGVHGTRPCAGHLREDASGRGRMAGPHGVDEDTPPEQAAWAEFRRLEDLIEVTVASTPEGVAAQPVHEDELR